MTRFVYGATTLQFNTDPSKPGGTAPRLVQNRERDSSGDTYVYGKSATVHTRHRLRFDGHNAIDFATLDALRTFIRVNVQGVSRLFTWVDHLGAARTVRFAEPKLSWQQVGPDHYAVELILEETS